MLCSERDASSRVVFLSGTDRNCLQDVASSDKPDNKPPVLSFNPPSGGVALVVLHILERTPHALWLAHRSEDQPPSSQAFVAL
jgi:hypothetical protein